MRELNEGERAEFAALIKVAERSKLELQRAQAKHAAAVADAEIRVADLREACDVPADAYPRQGTLEWVTIMGRNEQGQPVEVPCIQPEPVEEPGT